MVPRLKRSKKLRFRDLKETRNYASETEKKHETMVPRLKVGSDTEKKQETMLPRLKRNKKLLFRD